VASEALDCFEVDVTVTRQDSGVTFVNGRAQQAPTSTFVIRASVQPTTPDDLQELPELERSTESIMLLTETELFTSRQSISQAADLIEYRGLQWKVIMVERFDTTLLNLDHYTIIAQRTGKG
jgi:hypothetical protein